MTSGFVQTVLGPVPPDRLGLTHTHEHLLIDMRCYHWLPEEATRREWVNAPLTIDRLGSVSRNQNACLDEITLLDERAAISELSSFRLAGGGTVVDTTSIGIARDPLALARISRATGVTIVMGAGYYVPQSHPDDMVERTEESIRQRIVRDLTIGVGNTGVRSGIIGELGNNYPLGESERKVLRASAGAARSTGASILIHPGFHPASPPEIMEVLLGAGADPERVVMGHLDHIGDRDALMDLAATGCYLEWDTFGFEDTSLGAALSCPIPSDAERIDELEAFADAGYLDRLLMAHDVCVKSRHATHGGRNFDHILASVVPRMKSRGWSNQDIEMVLVDNPARMLTLAPA